MGLEIVISHLDVAFISDICSYIGILLLCIGIILLGKLIIEISAAFMFPVPYPKLRWVVGSAIITTGIVLLIITIMKATGILIITTVN